MFSIRPELPTKDIIAALSARPDFKPGGDLDYWLVLGVWAPGEGAALYVTDDESTNSAEPERAESRGTWNGVDLFHYLLDGVYEPTCAALAATRLRCCEVMVLRRGFPPIFPPLRPIAAMYAGKA